MSILNVPLTDNWVRLNRYSEQYTNSNTMDIAKDPLQGASLNGLTRIGRPSTPSGTVIKSAKLVFELISAPSVDGYFEVDQLNGGNLSSEEGYFENLSVADYYQRLITPSTPIGEQEIDITGAFRNSFGFIGLRYRVRQRNDGPGASTVNITIKPKHIAIEFEYIPKEPVNLFPNGGESVYGLTDITWEAPSVITAPSSELHYEVQFSPNNGQTWSSIGTTGLGITSLSHDFTNIPETSLAKVRVRAVHGATPGAWLTSAGVFSLKRDIAPYAPANLAPTGILVDRSLTQRLTWKHSDPNPNDIQSKADVQYRKQGDTQWTALTVTGSDNEIFIPPNTFLAGQIEWRVRTYDQGGLYSPYSNISVFTSSDPTNAPVITSPSSIVNASRPVIEWTGGAQQSYQVLIEDALNNVVWDTGEVISSIKARTVGIDLINGATYKIKVRIKDGTGLFSSYTDKTITISYTPPAKPILNTYINLDHIALAIDNPLPNNQPNVLHNDLYKFVDGNWMRIAKGLQGTYSDYALESGEVAQYRVRAIGENNTYSESDVVNVKGSKLRMVYMHDVLDPVSTIHGFVHESKNGISENPQVEHAYMQYAGRKKLSIEWGTFETNSISVSIALNKRRMDREKLIYLLKNRSTIMYRDYRGRKMYCTFVGAPLDDVFYGNTTTINLQEIDYNEEV